MLKDGNERESYALELGGMIAQLVYVVHLEITYIGNLYQ